MNELLNRFLADTGSTTTFLESLLGERLHVHVVRQTECATETALERESVLYGPSSGPLVAAHCSLSLLAMTNVEKRALRLAQAPIGRVFARPESALRKLQIAVEKITSRRLPQLLQTDESTFFLKSYELWHLDRRIGRFGEVVSERSISRAQPAPLHASVGSSR